MDPVARAKYMEKMDKKNTKKAMSSRVKMVK
jgi:hypothetical protein